jgi:hypothetical protein
MLTMGRREKERRNRKLKGYAKFTFAMFCRRSLGGFLVPLLMCLLCCISWSCFKLPLITIDDFAPLSLAGAFSAVVPEPACAGTSEAADAASDVDHRLRPALLVLPAGRDPARSAHSTAPRRRRACEHASPPHVPLPRRRTEPWWEPSPAPTNFKMRFTEDGDDIAARFSGTRIDWAPMPRRIPRAASISQILLQCQFSKKSVDRWIK